MTEQHENIAFTPHNNHRIATVTHDAGGDSIVVFCHGFKGTKIGPARLFVRAARLLAAEGISSLRFDQYGSGDSDGDFIDSSFDDWIATTRAIVDHYLDAGRRVALFGQSMGGATAIAVASDVPAISALVTWSAGANIYPFVPSPTGIMEEEGQLVRDAYWREAHEVNIADRFARITCPAYVLFGTADHFIDEPNRRAITDRAQPHHRIDVIEGMAHSAWPAAMGEQIVSESCRFIVEQFLHSSRT